jgi:cation diffusion facilitator CzcD-associated flavoprotein CzcO
VPKLAERFADDVFQTHAVGYRRPDEVPPGTVLVVGGGNTGFQIAEEFSATHKVVLSIGSRQTPLPPAPARTRPQTRLQFLAAPLHGPVWAAVDDRDAHFVDQVGDLRETPSLLRPIHGRRLVLLC